MECCPTPALPAWHNLTGQRILYIARSFVKNFASVTGACPINGTLRNRISRKLRLSLIKVDVIEANAQCRVLKHATSFRKPQNNHKHPSHRDSSARYWIMQNTISCGKKSRARLPEHYLAYIVVTPITTVDRNIITSSSVSCADRTTR